MNPKKDTTRPFKAYIAANSETRPFDSARGKTPATAKAAVKRKNSPDWKDLYIFAVYVHTNGREERNP